MAQSLLHSQANLFLCASNIIVMRKRRILNRHSTLDLAGVLGERLGGGEGLRGGLHHRKKILLREI